MGRATNKICLRWVRAPVGDDIVVGVGVVVSVSVADVVISCDVVVDAVDCCLLTYVLLVFGFLLFVVFVSAVYNHGRRCSLTCG